MSNPGPFLYIVSSTSTVSSIVLGKSWVATWELEKRINDPPVGSLHDATFVALLAAVRKKPRQFPRYVGT